MHVFPFLCCCCCRLSTWNYPTHPQCSAHRFDGAAGEREENVRYRKTECNLQLSLRHNTNSNLSTFACVYVVDISIYFFLLVRSIFVHSFIHHMIIVHFYPLFSFSLSVFMLSRWFPFRSSYWDVLTMKHVLFCIIWQRRMGNIRIHSHVFRSFSTKTSADEECRRNFRLWQRISVASGITYCRPMIRLITFVIGMF